MKKIQLTLVILIVASAFLTACMNLPEEPQEVLPFCKELYADLLVGDPDFPPAFIGYCVATLQTGEDRAAQALCGYQVIWDEIGASSRKECIQYFKALQ